MSKRIEQEYFAHTIISLLPRFPKLNPGVNDVMKTEKIDGWYYTLQRTVWDDGVYDILIQRRTWQDDDRPRTKRECKYNAIWCQPINMDTQHHFTLEIDGWRFSNVMKR